MYDEKVTCFIWNIFTFILMMYSKLPRVCSKMTSISLNMINIWNIKIMLETDLLSRKKTIAAFKQSNILIELGKCNKRNFWVFKKCMQCLGNLSHWMSLCVRV